MIPDKEKEKENNHLLHSLTELISSNTAFSTLELKHTYVHQYPDKGLHTVHKIQSLSSSQEDNSMPVFVLF